MQDNPISSWLKSNGKTQAWLADQVPCRRATVSAWVKGTKPRPEQMDRIAQITNGGVPVTVWFQSGAAA